MNESKKSMSLKRFTRDLRRGLGSAIVELKENPDREKYRKIVLRCCLKNIAYDTQFEGSKGYYLYAAIRTFETKDDFESIIISAFMKRLEYNLFQQLTDILCQLAEDGCKKAINALRRKYHDLLKQLARQKSFPSKYREREQFEYLMICAVNTNNWPAFRRCITDAGSIIMNRNDDKCNAYDWFLSHCRYSFGKERITQFFDSAHNTSMEVKAFAEATDELERVRENHSRQRVESTVTLESYVTRARSVEKKDYSYSDLFYSATRFSRQTNQGDLLELVSIIANEPSDEIRVNLLRVFRYTDFPADISLLIGYAESANGQLCDIAVDALGRVKDPRVHDLAIKFIENGNLDHGLHLLINNWRKQDEELIHERVLGSKRVSHSMHQDLRDIYSNHRSKSCGAILEHAYWYGECSFCRSGIVRVMWKNRVLKTSILNECLYDSYDETRAMARKILKRLK